MNQRPFHLMAKPIGPICNIRCEYCFYLSKEKLFSHQRKADFAMREDVLETFIRQYIEAQPEGTKEITFAWQGGEPTLLPQSFFEKAVALEKECVRPGMKIQNAFQTNGTLVDRSRAEWFAENSFLVGVSIDGPEDLHNRYRLDRNGNGTFRDVMAGIEHLKAAGVEFNTLTVVQENNAKYPERVYTFLKSIGSTFLQFIPIVEPVPGGGAGSQRGVDQHSSGSSGSIASSGGVGSRSAGVVSNRSVSAAAWGSFMNGVFDRWVRKDIGKIYVQHFDLLLGLYAGYPSSLCVHAETCGNALAIEHDGTIYSCDHFVFPEYRLGNVVEEHVREIVNKPQQIKFGNDKRDGLPDVCRTCRYLHLCRGGCPNDRLIESPGGRLNILCEGYYSLYEHTEPHFRAMAQALAHGLPASEFRRFFRIDPGPYGSGKKFKVYHGAER